MHVLCRSRRFSFVRTALLLFLCRYFRDALLQNKHKSKQDVPKSKKKKQAAKRCRSVLSRGREKSNRAILSEQGFWHGTMKPGVIEAAATVAVCMVAVAECTATGAQYGVARGAWSGRPRRQASFCRSLGTWLDKMVPPIPVCLWRGPVRCRRRVAACAAGNGTRHTPRQARYDGCRHRPRPPFLRRIRRRCRVAESRGRRWLPPGQFRRRSTRYDQSYERLACTSGGGLRALWHACFVFSLRSSHAPRAHEKRSDSSKMGCD